jgi:hypothetical protein
MESVESSIKSGEIEPVDYLVYGSYYESGNHITLECRLLDYKKGFVIGQFTYNESGKESLPQLALRAAKRIYDMIPYRGRVIKLKDTGIIVNVGLFDGIAAGQKLVIYKFRNDIAPGDKLKKKILFTVKESDTLISYAEPQNPSDLDSIESNDIVLPLKKRRAKLID